MLVLVTGVLYILLKIVIVVSFTLTPGASFSEVIFSHTSLLVSISSLSYTPDAIFSEEFLLHSSC